jgi:hypothetical protein
MANPVPAIVRFRPQVAALALAVFTAGCQTAAQQQAEADPMAWGRFDCKRSALDPAIAADFEQAKTVCIGRAEAAAVAGTASIRPGYSMGSAIVAGIEAGQKQSQISMATGTSCMAEYGWRYNKRSEYEALCPQPAPKPASPPVVNKKPTS